MNGDPALLVFRGETLEVQDLERGWVVRLGDREVRETYLDQALEALLGVPRSEVLDLMRQVAEMEREPSTHQRRPQA